MLRYGMLAVAMGLATAVSGFAQERARIVDLRPTMDVVRGGQKGMLIRLDSEIDGLQGRTVLIRALSCPRTSDLFQIDLFWQWSGQRRIVSKSSKPTGW
jgi:hypothetical protein